MQEPAISFNYCNILFWQLKVKHDTLHFAINPQLITNSPLIMQSWVLGGLPYPSVHLLFSYCTAWVMERNAPNVMICLYKGSKLWTHTIQKWFDLGDEISKSYVLDNDLIQWVKFEEDLKMSTFLFIDLTWFHPFLFNNLAQIPLVSI